MPSGFTRRGINRFDQQCRAVNQGFSAPVTTPQFSQRFGRHGPAQRRRFTSKAAAFHSSIYSPCPPAQPLCPSPAGFGANGRQQHARQNPAQGFSIAQQQAGVGARPGCVSRAASFPSRKPVLSGKQAKTGDQGHHQATGEFRPTGARVVPGRNGQATFAAVQRGVLTPPGCGRTRFTYFQYSPRAPCRTRGFAG